MIYKYVAIGVLFSSVIYVGGQIKRAYEKKYRYLDRLNSFLIRLKNEIETNKTPIIKIVENEIKSGGVLENTLTNYQERITNKQEIENIAPSNIFLSKTEKAKIEDLFVNLGSFDHESELSFIKKKESEIDEMLKDAKQDKIKKGDLYFKLSVMLAFAITLLLL